jgi:uncharacterized membrane protein YphA (DoxX/SURF4 family)
VSGKRGERAGGAALRTSARALADRRLTLVLRFLAGATLIFASYHKLLDPQPFADAIDNYRVLPLALVNLTALTLPWMEFVTGLCLLIGLGTAGAGALTAAMAAVFTGALVSALVRGLEIGCACFDGGTVPLAWHDLWLRLALFAAGVQIASTARPLDQPLMGLVRLSDQRARRRRSDV